MTTPRVALMIFRRASAAFHLYEELRATWTRPIRVPSTVIAQRTAARALVESALKVKYGVDTLGEVERAYAADVHYCQQLLKQTALDLGEAVLGQMQNFHNGIWNRYLHRTEGQAARLRHFARALAAWLVYKSGSVYPYLEEDESWWRRTKGLPPAPGVVQHSVPLASGGTPPSPDPLDGGMPLPHYETPRPGQPGGADLPGRWAPWSEGTSAQHARYALHSFGVTNEAALKSKLLDLDRDGHPILLLVEQRLGEPAPITPADLYRTLRKEPTQRDQELLHLVRRVEQYLAEGKNTFRDALAERRWEELRPLLENANRLLGAELEEEGTDLRLDEFGHHLIEEIVGWTRQEVFQAATLGISVGLGILLAIPSAGGSLIASAVAVRAALAAFDAATLAISVGIAVEQYRVRTRANRFAALDEAMRVASATDDLRSDVTWDILFAVAPPVLGRAARVTRHAWLGRVARAAPSPRAAGVSLSTAERRAVPEVEVVPPAARTERTEPSGAGRSTASEQRATRRAGERGQQGVSHAERAVAREVVGPAGRRRVLDQLDREIDEAIEQAMHAAPPPAALPEDDLAQFVVDREQQQTARRVLGSTFDRPPRAVSIAESARHREAMEKTMERLEHRSPAMLEAELEQAEKRAVSILQRIRRHWDEALPPGMTREQAVEDVMQRFWVEVPERPNRWIREHLFDNWRDRAVRRIGGDPQLVRDLREHAGIIIARRPPSGRFSLRLRTRLPDGSMTHTWLNFDHARIGHSEAVIDAYELDDARNLLSTVSSDNLRLLTARENQVVIEAYRRSQRRIDELRASWAGK